LLNKPFRFGIFMDRDCRIGTEIPQSLL